MASLKLETIAPALFVLLWSTGWLVATYSNPHSDPLTFLFVRFVLSAALFIGIALVMRARWPIGYALNSHALLSGIFLHTIYLGGVWWAIDRGVPTSVSGLLAALQPLLTALLAYWTVGERLTKRQIQGLFLGFIGLLIAIAPSLLNLRGEALIAALIPLAVNAIGMIAVTVGTVYQKRVFSQNALIPVAALQYVGGAVAIAPAALLLEPNLRMDWNFEVFAAMAWSVIGLSFGAIMLLLVLIQRGQVSRAASLIYLIPPVVAVEAWLFFGEQLTTPLILGTAIVVVGVWLVNSKGRPTARSE
ncbi:MAG: DMT family transporter [Pseudomonadota bacterium]